MRPYTSNISGRQIDLEFLQSSGIPSGRYSLSASVSSRQPAVVSGVQKAIQRYVSLLLSPAASRRFPGSLSNSLLSSVRSGSVSNEAQLRHVFNVASAEAIDLMRSDDYNIEKFGESSSDERIASASLSNISIDYQTTTVSLSIDFLTEAGTSYTYIVPVRDRLRD